VKHCAAYERDSERLWDVLHAQQRFRPRAPSEPVVRFLATQPGDPSTLGAIDIGVGGGRHTKLLCDLGFQVTGVDLSSEGLRQCEAWLRSDGQVAELVQASMQLLPFPDESFDLAVAFGTYYYADAGGMRRAVAELHRVLRKGGRALVVARTDRDYRYGKGAQLEPDTFRLDIEDTNERGAVMHFLRENAVSQMFAVFSRVMFELTEVTFAARTQRNSDWIIQVTR
jgi:SAM-dependent methyltransferase